MRPAALLALALSLPALSLTLPGAARADDPVELPPVVITARGPTVFTHLPRARVRDRQEEPRAELARRVPPTVRRAPF